MFYGKSDMHVRPMRFSILHSNWLLWSNPIDVFYYIAVLVYIQIQYYWKQAEPQHHVQQQI